MTSDDKVFSAVAVSESIIFIGERVLRQAGFAKGITDKVRGPLSQLHWIMTSETRNHTKFFYSRYTSE